MEASAEREAPIYAAAPFGLLRLPRLPMQPVPADAPDLDPESPDQRDRLLAYLRQAAADPLVYEALAVSSASLAHTLSLIDSGLPVATARLKRAVYSVTKYQLRMSHRPMPFGLMAGVATLDFGNRTQFRHDSEVTKAARPDMGWLMELVRSWERHPDVLRRLRLVGNDLALVRGTRLIMPGVRHISDPGPQNHEISVSNTAAVQRAMSLTVRPVSYPDLVEELLSAFPGSAKHHITAMLDTLIEHEILLTDLRPPQHAPDPLEHVVERLSAAGHPQAVQLTTVRDSISTFESSLAGQAHGAVLQVKQALAAVLPGNRSLQVDMRVDAHAVLPVNVAEELATAADVLWRTNPDPVPAYLRDYHQAFVERYGYDHGVGLKELLDPLRGLGAPAGYQWPPAQRKEEAPPPGDTNRAQILAGLVQKSLVVGAREILLDESVLRELTSTNLEVDSPQSLDLCATVLADSLETMRAGEFHLALPPTIGAPCAGSYFGRFLHMLPELVPSLQCLIKEVHEGEGALPVQVFFQPTDDRYGNVSRVPQVLPHRMVIGGYDNREDPATLPLSDLLIVADSAGLRVVSRSMDREIVPIFLHLLNPHTGKPNVVRLLGDIAQVRRRSARPWLWGDLARLPYLPRVRYGRTALTPARWLPSPGLKDHSRSWGSWLTALEEWRELWSVPSKIEIVSEDQRLPIDLDITLHQRLFRQEISKVRRLTVAELPMGGQFGTGWTEGYANEIVVPLVPRGDSPKPVRSTATVTVASAGRVHQPGGEWLFAKLYLPEEHQDELLTEHLPDLLDQVEDLVDRWFFMRYRDPEPHIRLRLHGEPPVLWGNVLASLNDWAGAAREAGVLQRTIMDTYEPEYTRYGGEELMELAEKAFAADSRAVIDQLRLISQGRLALEPMLVLASDHLDAARGLYGRAWADWLLLTYPKKEDTHGEFQSRRTPARALDPTGEWRALSGVPGGPLLITTWAERSAAYARYGEALRTRFGDQAPLVRGAASSMLHMHSNRFLGIDENLEKASYAVARGIVETVRNRSRFLR
ncbi:lantibiotic dehydratase [Nonomuraea sp. KM90]|uniref:lantibiotic dehydratase n=1 Tax=Nonomuraea sp. KM90 TaxID=3457428 RepID=UPI003FCE127E